MVFHIICMFTALSVILFMPLPVHEWRTEAATTNGEVIWNSTFGGERYDRGTCFQPAGDGLVITGWTQSRGVKNDDVLLVKTDASGNEVWNKTFGGGASDKSFYLQSTEDGYLIVGTTSSFGAGGGDVWLVKTDVNGVEQWNRTFGGTGYDKGYCIQKAPDGGFVLLGLTYSYGAEKGDVWLIKVDDAGNEMWNRTFGGNETDVGFYVEGDDDGYIITGVTYSFGAGGVDAWLIKTDLNGFEQWNHTFGGPLDDVGNAAVRTPDGGYLMVGETHSFGAGKNDLWLLKTDATGREMWNRTVGGEDYDKGTFIQPTVNGNYIITGMTYSFGIGKNDLWLVEVDASGNERWNRTFGGADYDIGFHVQQADDGSYMVTGVTYSFGAGSGDVWLLRYMPPAIVPEDTSFTPGFTIFMFMGAVLFMLLLRKTKG